MNKKIVFSFALTATLAFFAVAISRADDSATNSERNAYRPQGKRVFEPLPAGAVKPSGWLRDWALAARDGYTAVMDDVDPEFPRAWAADFAPHCQIGDWGAGAWSFEGGGYWFDGLARLAWQLDDPELKALVEKRLAPALENATPDGIGFFYWLSPQTPADLESTRPDYGWGLWANGLFNRAVLEYYKASGDERALRALQFAADSSDFGCITVAGLGSAPNNAFNVCEVAEATGDRGVAETLTRAFSSDGDAMKNHVGLFDKTGENWGDLWKPFRTPPSDALKNGEKDYPDYWVSRFHGVTFNETLAGWAAGTYWTGRPEYLETAVAWAELMDERCLQPYGALVEDELYGPSGAYRCTETCTLAAELWRRFQLFSLVGKGADADKIERLFFNAAAGSVSRDFTKHVYFQQPNRIATNAFIYTWGAPTNCVLQRKHYPLCCTAGVNRLVPTFTQYLWAKTDAGIADKEGLAAVLYAPNTLETTLRGVNVSIETTTNYPFDDTLELTINVDAPEKELDFPLCLRVPSWCDEPLATINGSNLLAPVENGFWVVDHTWRSGDRISLKFPAKAKLELGVDRNAKELPVPTGGAWGKGAVLGMFPDSETSAVPCASISFGPLLFALPLPEADATENVATPDARWQFVLDPETALENVKIIRDSAASPVAWSATTPPIRMEINAVSASWPTNPAFPRLPFADETTLGATETLELVPYGCAKLRVSVFPVVEKNDGDASQR